MIELGPGGSSFSRLVMMAEAGEKLLEATQELLAMHPPSALSGRQIAEVAAGTSVRSRHSSIAPYNNSASASHKTRAPRSR